MSALKVRGGSPFSLYKNQGFNLPVPSHQNLGSPVFFSDPGDSCTCFSPFQAYVTWCSPIQVSFARGFFQAYVEKMRSPGNWGSQLELMAICREFAVRRGAEKDRKEEV